MKVSNNNSNYLNYKSTNVYISPNIVNILKSLDVEIEKKEENTLLLNEDKDLKLNKFLNEIKDGLKEKGNRKFTYYQGEDKISSVLKAYNRTENFRLKNIPDKLSLNNHTNNQVNQFYFPTQTYPNINTKDDVQENSINEAIVKTENPNKNKVTNKSETPVKAKKSNVGNKSSSMGTKTAKRRKDIADSSDDLYCLKNCIYERKDCNQRMIYCEGNCKTWYHIQCIEISDDKLKEIGDKEWVCDKCSKLLSK